MGQGFEPCRVQTLFIGRSNEGKTCAKHPMAVAFGVENVVRDQRLPVRVFHPVRCLTRLIQREEV
jgi:hypothetical protein